MDLSKIHLNEVLRVKKYNDCSKFYKPKEIYLIDPLVKEVKISRDEYNNLYKKDIDYKRVVYGYYITDEIYYYLEKITDFYVLIKRFWKNQIIVLLDEKRYDIFKKKISFFEFKSFCISMEYKEGLFRYNKEDIE